MAMFEENRVCNLLATTYPIIQAGMVWVSGYKLAVAAAESGCLGVIGAGSMPPPLLAEHIKKAKALTEQPLAVNFPLLYQDVDKQIDIALELGINIFITSAGSPKTHTKKLKSQGATVLHVASNPTLAKKCEDAGVDAVIVEGFEAGGHNGRDELTTMVLTPQAVASVHIPIIAAGGIGSGCSMAAAMALGAEGVQIGSCFVTTVESSAHDHFKTAVTNAKPNDTRLCMKELVPVRLLTNKFSDQVTALEQSSTYTKEALRELLGKGRARRGMLEGEIDEGELEIGQISGAITKIQTAAELIAEIIRDFDQTVERLQSLRHFQK